MTFLLRLALRNTLRNKRRSAFTIASLFLGTSVFVLSKSFVDGIEKTLVAVVIDAEHGHVRITTKSYLEEEDYYPLDVPFPEAAEVAATLTKEHPGALVVSRSSFSAQIGDGVDSLNVRGLVVDPANYTALFRIGELEAPADPSIPYAWVGADVAKAFGWKAGDRMFLRAKTRTGTLNALEGVVIAGLISSGSPPTDNFSIAVPRSWAGPFLNLEPDSATEVVARFPDADTADVVDAALANRWPALDCETWRETTKFARDLNEVRREQFYLCVAIILFIGALSVANTCLMAAFERTKEIGTLMAVGYPAAKIRALFVAETTILGVFGALLGAGVGAAASAYLSVHPIPLQGLEEAEGAMPMPSLLYFDLTPEAVVIGFAIGLIVALLASLYPAVRASRLDPINALREE